MQIKLNGKSHTVADGSSVAELAVALAVNLRQVAIERNREIVPRSLYDEVRVEQGDEIEIVQFIGGG